MAKFLLACSVPKIAQIIELSYEPVLWALCGLWTHPGQYEDRRQVLWDTLYLYVHTQILRFLITLRKHLPL
jgi:hypothetical protein